MSDDCRALQAQKDNHHGERPDGPDIKPLEQTRKLLAEVLQSVTADQEVHHVSLAHERDRR